jgi:hypothetical protein
LQSAHCGGIFGATAQCAALRRNERNERHFDFSLVLAGARGEDVGLARLDVGLWPPHTRLPALLDLLGRRLADAVNLAPAVVVIAAQPRMGEIAARHITAAT